MIFIVSFFVPLGDRRLNVVMFDAMDACLFIKVSVSISHLLYADDVLFIGKWSQLNVKNLIAILNSFHVVSGLQIDLHKTKIYGTGMRWCKTWLMLRVVMLINSLFCT